MSSFADQIILQFAQESTNGGPETFTEKFLKTKLEAGLGAQALFDLTYDVEDVEIKAIEIGSVIDKHFGIPVFETIHTTATHERIIPDTQRTQVRQSQPRLGRLAWIDVLLEVRLSASIHDLSAKIKEITVEDLFHKIGDVSTLAELRAALAVLYPTSIVDVFFERFKITSIDEFKQRGNLFVTFVFEQPPAYDSQDPSAAKAYSVNVCVLVAGELEVVEALQRAKLCRSILENERDYMETFSGGDIKSPYAFIMIFGDNAVRNNAIDGFTAAQIREYIKLVFTAEGMIAHFE